MFPAAFRVGPVEVYWYPLFLVAAFGVGAAVLAWQGPRRGVPRSAVGELVAVAAVGGLVGARALYVASHAADYARYPWRALMVQQGGLAFYGGLAGGSLALIVYARAIGVSRAGLADAAALALPAGSAVGRIGCFAAGCCSGRPTASVLGVVFPGGAGRVIPTQLVDLVAEVALFLLLLAMSGRLAERPGSLMWAYLVLYAVWRFGVEFLRGEPTFALGLTLAQWISGAALVVGVAAYARRPRNGAPA